MPDLLVATRLAAIAAVEKLALTEAAPHLAALVKSPSLPAPVRVAAWMVIIIVARELSITGLRLLAASKNIVQGLTVVPEMDKREALRRLIKSQEVKNAIVFCNRKKDVAILQGSLKKHGFNAGALHGDMSQPARMETLEKFKQGEIQILVASDVAARGLDINDMSHVFNFDVPFSPEDYVHRIGRTGRAGKTGHSFTLATPDEGHLVEAIEKLIGTTIPRIEIEGLDAVAFAAPDLSARWSVPVKLREAFAHCGRLQRLDRLIV